MFKQKNLLKTGIKKVMAFVLTFTLAATAAVPALAADTKAASATYPKKLSDIQVDNPFIYADEETQTYYLYTSNRDVKNPGVIAYQSKDLKNWSGATVVYTVPTGDEAWNAKEQPASPSVYQYDGKYYLMVTLQNSDNILQSGMGGTGWDSSSNRWNDKYPKSTIIAVADSPLGTFKDLDTTKSQGPNQDQVMTMDGSLYVDPNGNASMVYAHDWATKIDGIIEYIPMKKDLTAAADKQKVLFRASLSAVNDDMNYGAEKGYVDANSDQLSPYKAYAPRVYTAPDGSLVMLWTTECHGSFVQVQAVAKTGNIEGRWDQKMPILTGDKGFGMSFETFDGKTMIMVQNNMSGNIHHAELYDASLTNNGFKITSHRSDLDEVSGVSIKDTTAPKIYVPSTRVVETSEKTVKVPFTAIAEDDVDGTVDVEYSIQPNSEFKQGSTKVIVGATDSAGNTATKSFTVVVKEPEEKEAVTPTTNSATEYPRTLPDMSCHDPYILADEASQTYYFYTASNLRDSEGKRISGVMAYQSKDLVHWSEPSVVYEVGYNVTNPWYTTSSPWAPEVHAYNGKYYMFTTLHNTRDIIADVKPGLDSDRWTQTYRRASVIAVSDSPEGPFTELSPSNPVTGRDLMTLDGSLYVAPDGTPYLVYAHEWVQKLDGTVEAIELTDDLTKGVGNPFLLFRASSAPWYEWDGLMYDQYGARYSTVEDHKQLSDKQLPGYVTDGVHFHTTPNGSLVTLWTTYRDDKYIMTQAISRTGNIEGPWEQLAPLDYSDKGHSMVFETFDGKLMLCMHNNMSGGMDGNGGPVRAEIYEMELTDDGFKYVEHREDIDGVKDVDIDDHLAPILFNSADRYVSVVNGETSAPVSFAAEAVDDHNLDMDVTYSIAPNSQFNIGKTEVTVSAQDAAGNKAEDSFNVYVINKTALKTAMDQASALNAADYTAESYAAVQQALAQVSPIFKGMYSSQAKVDEAAATLTNALGLLKKAETTPGVTVPTTNPTADPAVGQAITVGNAVYTITVQGSEVAYKAPAKKTATVKIPSKVTINGKSYKVTSIAKNAFKNNKKVKNVTIGGNVKTIGKSAFEKSTLKKVTIPASVTSIKSKAFYNCKNLTSVKIKTKKLTAKKVGSKAFKYAGKSNYKKLKVKVPSTKVKAYKTILRKKGLSTKAKVTK